jgi:hypothetical protein
MACIGSSGDLRSQSPPVGQVIPDLVLKDQYDKEFHLVAHRDKPLLLMYGDRTGNEYMNAWVGPVRAEFSREALPIVTVADLRSVPGFVHGFVKDKFRGLNKDGKPKSAVLLDWEGKLGSVLGSTQSVTNVYLVDTQNVLRYRAAGQGTKEETSRLLQALRPICPQENKP